MAEAKTMKAVQIHAFGGPETLRFEEIPVPEPGPGEALIRVHAAGVNPADWKIREGHLGERAFPCLMGVDFSGTVERLGPGAGDFQPGDEVFGRVGNGSGSYAEYAIAPVERMARKPAALDHTHAAAIPVAALTAWQALFDIGHLEPHQTVLIHAAAGGVGGFAVQFAKWKRAQVAATASARNADFLHKLGVDQPIDYHSTKFEERLANLDLVLDTLGGDTQQRSWSVLKHGGTLVSTVQPPSEKTAGAFGVRGVFLVSAPRGDQLAEIADLVTQGHVRVFVEKTLPLADAREAQILSQSGHTRGKIVLLVA